MAWQSYAVTGRFVSTFTLAVLLGNGCTGGAGNAEFKPIAGNASGGSEPSGAGANSGAAQNQGGKSAAGSETGGSGSGGSAGTAAGGSDAGGSDDGGAGGTSAGGSNQGGSGGTGGGESGDCTSASFAGHDYSFCGIVDSGNAAFELCEKLGMVAVSIESKAENDFLIDELAGSTWIGASDEGHEGVWHWPNEDEFWNQTEDNEGPIPGRYQNWLEGQPNNANSDGLDENCAVLEISDATEGTWNDLACGIETEFRATCESPDVGIGSFPL
jgi:hypothetical protein